MDAEKVSSAECTASAGGVCRRAKCGKRGSRFTLKSDLGRHQPFKVYPVSRLSVRVTAPVKPPCPQERPPEEQGSASIRAPRDPVVRSLLFPTRTDLLPLMPRGNGWLLLEPGFSVDDAVGGAARRVLLACSLSEYRTDCSFALPHRLLFSEYRIDYSFAVPC